MHELVLGARVLREDASLFEEVNLMAFLVDEVVDVHMISEVAVEAIGFLDDDGHGALALAEQGHHLGEVDPTGLAGGLDVHELLDDL
ncbi:hypothetical protein D3C72_819470 [compost metagenome]